MFPPLSHTVALLAPLPMVHAPPSLMLRSDPARGVNAQKTKTFLSSNSIKSCYGLNVCVPLKLRMLNT